MLGISGEGGNSPTNVSTYFPGADHGFLFNFTKPALTTAGQAQAVTYIASGLNGTPTVIPPSAP